jgi:hypothetical protein
MENEQGRIKRNRDDMDKKIPYLQCLRMKPAGEISGDKTHEPLSD